MYLHDLMINESTLWKPYFACDLPIDLSPVSQCEWNQHMKHFKFTLQEQIRLLTELLEAKDYKKIQEVLASFYITPGGYEMKSIYPYISNSCNLKYILMQMNLLIAQRKKICQLFKDKKEIIDQILKHMLVEISSLETGMIILNKSANKEKRDKKYDVIEKAIKVYEEAVVIYYAKAWKDRKDFNLLSFELASNGNICGMDMIRRLQRMLGRNVSFVVSDETVGFITEWIKNLIKLAGREFNALDYLGFGGETPFLDDVAKNPKTRLQSIDQLTEILKLLTWTGSKENLAAEVVKEFEEATISFDSEEINTALADSGLCI